MELMPTTVYFNDSLSIQVVRDVPRTYNQIFSVAASMTEERQICIKFDAFGSRNKVIYFLQSIYIILFFQCSHTQNALKPKTLMTIHIRFATLVVIRVRFCMICSHMLKIWFCKQIHFNSDHMSLYEIAISYILMNSYDIRFYIN